MNRVPVHNNGMTPKGLKLADSREEMTDKDAGTPRVYLVRHGETEWTKSGRYTGITELELTPNGVQQVLNSKRLFVGPGKLLDAAKLARIFVSPRQRAAQTFKILFDSTVDMDHRDDNVEITNDLAEWDYGEHEGLVTKEIRERRKQQGLDTEREWDIWRDGCVDGETPREVTDRLDHLIGKIYEIQRPSMHGESPADVVLVAHGHLLRAFAKRWLKYSLAFPLSMMLEPGAVGVLSYQHHNINEPAFLLGVAFPEEGEMGNEIVNGGVKWEKI